MSSLSLQENNSPLRRERLAVNLYDLDRVDPVMRPKLLGGKLDLAHPLKTDWDRSKGEEEVALVFTCDLLPAAIICDTIRSHDRALGDFPTRLYLLKKSWSRVPSYWVLTQIVDGKCQLNPKIFSTEIELAPSIPPAIKPVLLKRK